MCSQDGKQEKLSPAQRWWNLLPTTMQYLLAIDYFATRALDTLEEAHIQYIYDYEVDKHTMT